MYAKTLSTIANVPLSVFGMLIFVFIFLAALAWIVKARPIQFYSALAQMPLRDDKEVSHDQ